MPRLTENFCFFWDTLMYNDTARSIVSTSIYLQDLHLFYIILEIGKYFGIQDTR